MRGLGQADAQANAGRPPSKIARMDDDDDDDDESFALLSYIF